MDKSTDGLSRSVLVLGGSNKGGIGWAVCERLQYLGHLSFAPPPGELDVVESSRQRWDEILEEGKPDAVVYSVGVNELDWSWELERNAFERIMAVNVWGFINTLKALQSTGSSYSVLAITSDAAYRAMRTSMAYCASKAALDMAIRVASRELSGEGWRINGLAPGKVAGTDMTTYVDDRVMQIRHFSSRAEAERYEMAGNPLGRKLYTEEIAAAACDILLSDSLGWTGDIITVNGGR